MSTPHDVEVTFVEIKSKLRRFKEEYAVEMLERIRARTPVLSGALKGGWGQTQRQDGFEIYNTQDYAGYVEYGTVHMAPRAMIRTTLVEKEQIKEVAFEKAGIKK